MDFGTKKGTSTASGVINGMGSVGGLLGGTIPGFFNERWGWGGVFGVLGVMAAIGGLMLLPKWNAVPPTARPASRGAAVPPVKKDGSQRESDHHRRGPGQQGSTP